MKKKGYLFGIPPLAWAIIVILIIILIATASPDVKKTIVDIGSAFSGK